MIGLSKDLEDEWRRTDKRGKVRTLDLTVQEIIYIIILLKVYVLLPLGVKAMAGIGKRGGWGFDIRPVSRMH